MVSGEIKWVPLRTVFSSQMYFIRLAIFRSLNSLTQAKFLNQFDRGMYICPQSSTISPDKVNARRLADGLKGAHIYHFLGQEGGWWYFKWVAVNQGLAI